MSTSFDPLTIGPGSSNRVKPERLFYAPGVLLDAPDLVAEQLYHRGRLARSLAYLHGSGTVSGLKVLFQSAVEPGGTAPADPENPAETSQTYPDGREARILVQPGLAIDRLGRQIEVPGPACLRLQPWLQEQTAPQLQQATHPQTGDADTPISLVDSPNAIAVGPTNRGIVADVFIRFQICEAGGRTPAFGAGNFDSTNANVPARLRDGYELSLVLRPEATEDLAIKLPANPWASANNFTELQQTIFDTWQETTADWDPQNRPEPRAEHTTDQDATAVFLARLLIVPTEIETAPTVQVDNYSREFVYPTGAVARRLDLTPA